MSDETQKTEKRKLRRKAALLWKLVTTTAGVADLAEPMKRAEYHFERLTQRQRVTVAVIASQLAKGFDEIDAEETAETETETETPATEATAEVITPDAIISAGEG